MTRYRLVLTNEDHAGAAHTLGVTTPADFPDVDVSDDDEAAIDLPESVSLDRLRAVLRVRCANCNVVLLEGEDFDFEEVNLWEQPTPDVSW